MGVGPPVGSGAGVGRGGPAGHARPEFDRGPADRPGEPRPFALGVARDVGAAAEAQRSRDEGFEQGGLAGANRPRNRQVGILQDPLLVQHPRVIDERPPRERVGADKHALAAEPGLGQERVRRRQRGGGRPVRLHPQRPPGPQCCRAGFAGSGQVGLVAALLPLRGAARLLSFLFGARELGG